MKPDEFGLSGGQAAPQFAAFGLVGNAAVEPRPQHLQPGLRSRTLESEPPSIIEEARMINPIAIAAERVGGTAPIEQSIPVGKDLAVAPREGHGSNQARRNTMKSTRPVLGFLLTLILGGPIAGLLRGAPAAGGGGVPIDFQRAQAIRKKVEAGETPTPEERAYVQRAMQEMQRRKGGQKSAPTAAAKPVSDPAVVARLVPLDELQGTYQGEDGGLYGGGRNRPPPAHLAAYLEASRQIQPLDAAGRPAGDGRIVLLSIGMSNTTMEFSRFKQVAEADPEKSSRVVVIDGAKGARTGLAWSLDGVDLLPAGEAEHLTAAFARSGRKMAQGPGDTWTGVEQKLKAGGVTSRQVQALWIKQAEAMPGKLGDFPEHARVLQASLVNILNIARHHYPNLRVAYLSSRIFGGYATTALNPEPYAYEEAFALRWVIQDQIKGNPRLNYDPARGAVTAPVVVWGPYLWANGNTPRRSDGLRWAPADFVASDHTHPDTSARQKVADLLLKFLKTDPGARRWFLPTAAAGPR